MNRALIAFTGVCAATVLSGCGDTGETPAQRYDRQNQERIEAIAPEFNVKAIKLPKAFYELDRGSYEVTVQTSEGQRRCIANVIATTHGAKNVVLTECKP